MSNEFRVKASALNFRTVPVVKKGNIIAVLNQGDKVIKLEQPPEIDKDWWLISTDIQGQRAEGFVAKRYLKSAATFREPAVHNRAEEIHIKENRPNIKRSRDGGRAFPLGESRRLNRTSNFTFGKVAEIGKIINWLKVDKSQRYQPTSSATFCNIYAYDYCYLAGVYSPRVWWTSKALGKLQQGLNIVPQYGTTIRELNANSLFDG